MKIQVYQIVFAGWGKPKKDKAIILSELKKSPVEHDEYGWDYGVVEVYDEGNVIYGMIGQEASEELIKYDDKKQLIGIKDYKWLKTFFSIDMSNGKLFVHKKRYTPKNLTHGKTVARLEDIFTKLFFKLYKQKVVLFPFRTGVNAKEFKEIFYSHTVLETKFSHISSSLVSEGADLHNPKKEWDKYRALSHNKYDAKILRTALLEAEEGQTLSKSPTARVFLESNSTGEKIKYQLDSGEIITEFRESPAVLEIHSDLSPEEEVHEFYTSFKQFLSRKKKEISKFKLFDGASDLINRGDDDDK